MLRMGVGEELGGEWEGGCGMGGDQHLCGFEGCRVADDGALCLQYSIFSHTPCHYLLVMIVETPRCHHSGPNLPVVCPTTQGTTPSSQDLVLFCVWKIILHCIANCAVPGQGGSQIDVNTTIWLDVRVAPTNSFVKACLET